MKNSNKVSYISQEKAQLYTVSQVIQDDSYAYVNSLTESEKCVFDLLLRLGLTHEKIYFSHDSLAKMAHVSLSSLKRALSKLEEDGVVSIDRYHRHTNFYTVTNYFFQPHLRRLLGVLSRSIMFANLLLAASQPIQAQPLKNDHFPGYELPLNNKGKIYNKKTFEGGGRKSTMYERVIPSYVQNLKELHLTQWGQMEMSKYPEAAVRYAMGELKKQKGKVYNPYGFVAATCKKYCAQNNLEIQWRKAKFLQETHSMPLGAPLVEKIVEQKLTQKKSHVLPKIQKQESTERVIQELTRRTDTIEDDFVCAVKAARECLESDNAFMRSLAFMNRWMNALSSDDQQKVRETVADKMSMTQPIVDKTSTVDAELRMKSWHDGSPILDAGQEEDEYAILDQH